MSNKDKYTEAIPSLLEQAGRMNDWEQEFMKSMQKQYDSSGTYSLGQQGIMDKLILKYIDGVEVNDKKNIGPFQYGDRVEARREEGGWQIYVNLRKVGETMTRKEQLVAGSFMRDSYDELGRMFKALKDDDEGADPLTDFPPRDEAQTETAGTASRF